ncbi:unnamed protein product, partial [marine sediment metagenome]
LNFSEVRVEIPATKKILAVSGYYDANIGGFKNWAERRKRIKERQIIETKVLEELSKQYEKESFEPLVYNFSKYLNWMSDKIIDGLEKLHPNGLLEPIICEIKSINSNAFWARRNFIAEGYPHHRLQLYFYLKATNTKSGALLYVSKDDLTLEECPLIYPNEQLEEEFEKDIKEMSSYYLSKKEPEPEPNLIFDKKKGKNGLWVVNWKMERSPYLTKITGLKKEEWIKQTKAEAKKLNMKKKNA